MMPKRPPRGLTLIELSVSLVLSALLMLLIGYAAKTGLSRSGRGVVARNEAQSEADALLLHLLDVGRLARSCTKVANETLECSVDFNAPPTGTVTRVRFTLVDNQVRYQTFDAGQWKTKVGYGAIASLDFCDDGDMSGGACDTRGVGPSVLNARHAANLGAPLGIATPAGRFFRFRIVSVLSASAAITGALQSAFFVRNPTSLQGVAYQWGKRIGK